VRKREAVTLVVKYVGGPESCWLIRRGTIAYRAPGCMALEDVMNRLGLVDL
jgi:hypothetical protein